MIPLLLPPYECEMCYVCHVPHVDYSTASAIAFEVEDVVVLDVDLPNPTNMTANSTGNMLIADYRNDEKNNNEKTGNDAMDVYEQNYSSR